MLGDSINDKLWTVLYFALNAETMESVAVTYYRFPTLVPDPLFEFFIMPRPSLDVDIGISRMKNVR